MTNILDGMTREQALLCVFERRVADESGFKSAAFRVENNSQLKADSYGCPGQIGLSENCIGVCAECWERHINAYYDERERPKWVEPKMYSDDFTTLWQEPRQHEGLPVSKAIRTEINRTNADRKIRAFIKENGGSGDWEIFRDDGEWVVDDFRLHGIGAITCASEELAREVLRRYEPELRTLVGGDA